MLRPQEGTGPHSVEIISASHCIIKRPTAWPNAARN